MRRCVPRLPPPADAAAPPGRSIEGGGSGRSREGGLVVERGGEWLVEGRGLVVEREGEW